MNKRQGKKLFRLQLTALWLLVPIVLLIIFRQQPAWVERFYYSGFYKIIGYGWRWLFNQFPFSVGDVFYGLLGALLLWGLILLVKHLIKKRFQLAGRVMLRFFILMESLWLVFYLFWGLNYYRPPAAELLHLQDTTYNKQDVERVTTLIIDSANACRARLNFNNHTTTNNIYKRSQDAVNALSTLSPVLQPVNARLKSSMFSWLINYMGTSGYYNPFTAEAQLNSLMPVFNKPFVACHEMAHQTGFAREDEANFAGYLAAVNTHDDLLKYSAYYAGMLEFMHYLRHRDSTVHHALRLQISPLVRQDIKTDSTYWAKYEGETQVISGLFFDRFLKSNNQPHGLKTYNRMIRLTMAYYRKRYRVW